MVNPISAGKNLMEMRKEAKKMKEQMQKIVVEGQSKKGWVKITINGAQEIVNIDMEDALMNPAKKKDLVQAIKESYEDANKKIQKEMVKDMDMSKIKDMLGM